MAVRPLNVSQLNKYIGRILTTDPILGNVRVRGEITNIKYHGSGHVFFTLKDENSKISCFMPSSYVEELRYELTDGMEITVTGRVSVYERGGYYSLTVRDVEVSGAGELALAFRALYEKLKKEGLFDQSHKKPLPEFPKKVCVITSETGAAVRDILKIIKSRNDVTDVMVYPCLVQGDSAAGDIASALDEVNERFREDVDLIIVGRGGGAAEDLWAFNEEVVARSIYRSEIPVISAVGHEIDFSISDYVADARAETPTAAAVMAVPDTGALAEELYRTMTEMNSALKRQVALRSSRLEIYGRGNMDRALRDRVRLWNDRCMHDWAMTGQKLSNRIQMLEERCRRDADAMTGALGSRIGILEERCIGNMKQLQTDMALGIKNREDAVNAGNSILEAAAPGKILARGYAIVRSGSDGKVMTTAESLRSLSSVELEMQDGRISLTNDIDRERKLK